MTLDEAIKHAEEVVEENERICQVIPEHSAGAFHCAEEHKQLAEWLKDYKRLLEQEPCEDWHDVPSDEMTLGQARQAVKDLRIKLAECLKQEPCEDTINRKAVLDIVDSHSDSQSNVEDVTQDIISDIMALPPVKPQTEIIRCCQCKYAEVADKEDAQDGYTCQFHRGSIWFGGSYCSWAERRTDG